MSASSSTDLTSQDHQDDDDDDHISLATPCGLRQCRKPKCNLKTHRRFVAARAEYLRWHKSRKQPSRITGLGLWPGNHVLDQSVSRIESQLEQGPHTLPFNSEARSMFRELAHHYFEHQIDRLIQVFSPHLDRNMYRSTMMEHAMSNDIFCVCITANAKTDMLMRANVRVADRDSQIVYGTTAQVLRQKLSNFRNTDLDWLLVLVVALVGFDLAFQRLDALKGHHDALRQIIALKGGVHAIGHTRPYILNTDRFLATFLGEYPIIKQTPLTPQPPPRLPPTKYGEAFDTLRVRSCIDSIVLDYCLSQCRMTDLIETYNISMAPRTMFTSDASIIPYFLYSRDHLASRGACLYADYHENRHISETKATTAPRSKTKRKFGPTSKSRCVLLAVLMMDYVVSHSNYYTIKGPFLGDQLKGILEKQSNSKWTEHIDMLLWLLFVLATVPARWAGQDWAMSKLRHWLAIKYGKHWHKIRWSEDQLANVRSFFWAKTLESQFHQVCEKLGSIKENGG